MRVDANLRRKFIHIRKTADKAAVFPIFKFRLCLATYEICIFSAFFIAPLFLCITHFFNKISEQIKKCAAKPHTEKRMAKALKTQTQCASLLLNFRFFGLSVLQGDSLASPLRTKKTKIFLI